jgi:hypothetical protein
LLTVPTKFYFVFLLQFGASLEAFSELFEKAQGIQKKWL